MEEKTNSFVTPGTEEPDVANGPFLSFHSDTGFVAYLQMTNDRAIWIKQVSEDGKFTNVMTFAAETCESIINYLKQRLKGSRWRHMVRSSSHAQDSAAMESLVSIWVLDVIGLRHRIVRRQRKHMA